MIGKQAWKTLAAAICVAGMAGDALGVSITVDAVGPYSPGVVGGPTNNDAASNSLANGISLAAFQPLVATAFANNSGGVVNFETAQGWVISDNTLATAFGDGAANPITARYGAGLTKGLRYWRNDVDPGNASMVGFDMNTNNGVNVVSGTGYMGIRGYSVSAPPPGNTASPINLVFGTGLKALGLTHVPRGQARTVTMTALLDDSTTLPGSPESITATNTPGAYFWGFHAPAGRTIVGLNILSPNGFARFDDLGFVVPEPSCAALLGLSSIVLMGLRRRR